MIRDSWLAVGTDMRTISLLSLLCLALSGFTADAQERPAPAAPFEIVKRHIDLEVLPDGSHVQSSEVAYRVLDTQGVEALHKIELSYSATYQDLRIGSAYTLKANGTRINVPQNGVLYGFGATSLPGFQDDKTLTILFPNVEVGDEVVLITIFIQKIPWYERQFAESYAFTRTTAAHDVRVTLTAPNAFPLRIDAVGLEGGTREVLGAKSRWIWQFHNDTPVVFEPDSIAESDTGARLTLTSFPDYASVARAYADRSRDKASITPEIRTLANELTAGVSDKREQAKRLYDWVTSRISYVAIVLGAGGFTPHTAAEVLRNRYGDCKDHVVLLEALLAAKDIASTPVLISLSNSYLLAEVPSPFFFNHAITYVPDFDLYVDSTAQLAPFGTLPNSDAGKPVLKVASGELAHTPVSSPSTSTLRAVSVVKLLSDGSGEGTAQISATGASAVDLRGLMKSIPPAKEGEYFRAALGPGADGKFERGEPDQLIEPYSIKTSYRVPNIVRFPGPGALPPGLSYKPFSFTSLIGGTLPLARNTDYICPSLSAEEESTVELPAGASIIAIPDPAEMQVEGIHLKVKYDRTGEHAIRMSYALTIEHAQAVCTSEYYARVRAGLASMTSALRGQILYK